MLLAIDVGNTQTVFGVFENGALTRDWRVATDAHRTADAIAALLDRLLELHEFELEDVDGVCVSSTVPVLVHEYEVFAERYLDAELLIVGPGVKTGIAILYDNPHEV